MPRILRSQGVHYLFPPILAAVPAAPPVQTTIRTRLVAVQTRRRFQVGLTDLKRPGVDPVFGPCISLNNNANGGTNGVTVTTANSGGASGNAWDTVAIGSGTALTFDNTHVLEGSLAYKFLQAAAGTPNVFLRWTEASFGGSPTEVIYGRVYLYRTANPAAGIVLIQAGLGALPPPLLTQISVLGGVNLNAAGTIRATDEHGNPTDGLVSIALNDWNRIEFKIVCDPVNGIVEAKLFKGANANGTVPDETITASGLNTGSQLDVLDFGYSGGADNNGVMWLDTINANCNQYPGPLLTADQASIKIRLAGRTRVEAPRRASHSKLRPPAVVAAAAAFVAEPIQVRTVTTRPRRTVQALRRPTTLQVFAGPKSSLTKARPRRTVWTLRPPTVIRVPAVEQQEQTIRVRLVRGRAGKTGWLLRPPTVVRVPSVEQQEQTLRVKLIRGRRPETTSRLFPPAVVAVVAAQTYPGPRTVLTRIRPPLTRRFLKSPTTLQTFPGPRVVLTRIRPRATDYRLIPPAVVEPALRLPDRRLRILTALVRIRPPKTRATLEPPTVLQTFPGPRVALTRTRPRPTTVRLRLPTVVRVPSVQQEQQTARVWLVQIRPRHTIFTLRLPRVIRTPSVEQAEQTIRVALTRARPRPTTKALRPPAVIVTNPPVVTQIRVELVQARPRRTAYQLRPPFIFKAKSDLRVRLVRTRPRPTVYRLGAPTTLRVFATGEMALVRARPRHTTYTLRPPTVVRQPPAITEARPSLVTTRPRHTIWTLRPPTVVRRAPEVTQQRVTLTRARPRPTTRVLRPATVIRVPSVEQQQRTIRVTLAAARRPTVHSRLPLVIGAAPAPPIRVTLARQSRGVPRSTLRPPAVVRAFVEPIARPIQTVLAAVRARLELVRHAPHSKLKPPGPTRKKGRACLIDVPAAILCLDDTAAFLACLQDVLGAAACLTDQPAAAACLDDQSAATAKLCDQKE